MQGMLGQVAAVLLGLLAVFWYLEDKDAHLGSLKDKRVLVTGASAGIGEQIAYQFARHGSHVTITARRQNVLEAVSRNCSRYSPNNRTHHVISGDMENVEQTRGIIDQAAEMMGGLDIVVLDHILPHPIQPFTGGQYDLDLLNRLLAVNFRSYVHLTAHALPKLSESGGRFVVINSAMGKISHPYLAAYAASKHAVAGFFSSLRSQFRATGVDIGVTCCYLGFIGTESAVKGVDVAGQRRLQAWVKPASPSDTAAAIVRAVASGQDELYYPWLDVWPTAVLYSVWPGGVDMLMRFLSVREG